MGDGKKCPMILGGKRVKIGFEFGTSNQGESENTKDTQDIKRK